MKNLRINIVLPFLTTRPSGGVKIMYEYANRLQQRGHQVTVIHSIQRPYRKIKSPVWWKQLNYRLRGINKPGWFQFHEGIRSIIVPEITDSQVPDADITMSTWWEMTYMISKLSAAKGRKFNLIQDYETWKGHEDLVHESYRLPVQNLVIAKYLQDLVARYSNTIPVHIPNAIDTNRFVLKEPVEKRNPFSVIMLYSEEHRKGTSFGIEALGLLRRQFPGLVVTLFGVYENPSIPGWIQYHHKPSDIPWLMNNHALFFSPSLGEGWALPPAEAMASGCAVVCTNIGGHADYAIDRVTALLTEPKNVNDMMEKLRELLLNQSLRIQLATESNRFITSQFSWEASVNKMEEEFLSAVG